MSYEVPALVAGLVVGSLVVYAVLHSRIMDHAQRIASLGPSHLQHCLTELR